MVTIDFIQNPVFWKNISESHVLVSQTACYYRLGILKEIQSAKLLKIIGLCCTESIGNSCKMEVTSHFGIIAHSPMTLSYILWLVGVTTSFRLITLQQSMWQGTDVVINHRICQWPVEVYVECFYFVDLEWNHYRRVAFSIFWLIVNNWKWCTFYPLLYKSPFLYHFVTCRETGWCLQRKIALQKQSWLV